MPLSIALGVSALIALAAWAVRALGRSGALAATSVGTLVLWSTGWAGCVVLGTFFVSSTLVGRLADHVQPAPDAKGETRDHWQVLSNGGVAAVVAPLEGLAPGLGVWLVTVTLAAAAADTWATSFGALSGKAPRDILRGCRVAPGTSGGVTWFGTSGGLMGAALVALAGGTSTAFHHHALYLSAAALGFAGMLIDSVLGSAVQARFFCPPCRQPTERRVHGCGTRTEPRKGWTWLDNDGVNAIATGLAAGLGALAWLAWASS